MPYDHWRVREAPLNAETSERLQRNAHVQAQVRRLLGPLPPHLVASGDLAGEDAAEGEEAALVADEGIILLTYIMSGPSGSQFIIALA